MLLLSELSPSQTRQYIDAKTTLQARCFTASRDANSGVDAASPSHIAN